MEKHLNNKQYKKSWHGDTSSQEIVSEEELGVKPIEQEQKRKGLQTQQINKTKQQTQESQKQILQIEESNIDELSDKEKNKVINRIAHKGNYATANLYFGSKTNLFLLNYMLSKGYMMVAANFTQAFFVKSEVNK